MAYKTGDKIGNWTILEKTDFKSTSGHYKWKCSCKCGKISFKAISEMKRIERCKKCYDLSQIHATETIPQNYWHQLQTSAKYRNHDFEISYEYATQIIEQQNFRCALSGQPITLISEGGYRRHKQTASIDRKDNDKGYVEGNVQWVHKDINKMKHALTEERFIEMCTAVAQHKNKEPLNG